MALQATFYILGIAFFLLWSLLLLVLIIGSLVMFWRLNQLQKKAQEKLDSMSMAAKLVPLVPLVLVQGKKWLRRLRL